MYKKKKILIFIDWYLPGYRAGGPVRSVANLIAHLNKEFDFYVITRNTDYCETAVYPDIKSDDWNVLPNGTNVLYLSEKNITITNLKLQISNLKSDYIYINGIYSFKFSIIPLLLSKKFKNAKIIIAARGMFAPGAIAIKKLKKLLFLKITKTLGYYNHVCFHATNEVEKNDIQTALGRSIKVMVASNLPAPFIGQECFPRTKESGTVKFVSIARIAPEKNTKYALEILSHIKGKVDFDLYGTIYNKNYWKECLQIIENLPENIKVKYCGSVENIVLPDILKKYHFLFMPTLGENFGHSVIESFTHGCPVLISDKTPWKNLEEKKIGWDVPLNETIKFVEIIEKCVEMPQHEFNEWSRSAFEYALKISADLNAVEQNRKLFL